MMARPERATHQSQPRWSGFKESSNGGGTCSSVRQAAATTGQGITYYCPPCWIEVEAGSQSCPHCHGDLAELELRTWCCKLLGALSHSEPTTRQRAVFILGELRDEGAVDTVVRVLTGSTDHFLCAGLSPRRERSVVHWRSNRWGVPWIIPRFWSARRHWPHWCVEGDRLQKRH